MWGRSRCGREGLVLLLVLLPYGIHVGTPALWDANEAFYVQGPREMQQAGDFLTPRFNFAQKLNKPILPYWLVLLSFRLFGVSAWAERLVIVLCVVGTVLLTYRLGRMFFDRRVALWGALILATSPKVIMVARRSLIDALLMLLVVAALWCVLAGWRHPAKERTFLILGAAAMGAGVLAKGLLGLVLPAGTLALFLLLQQRLDRVRWRDLGLAALVFCGVAAPWFAVMAWRYGGEYLSSFFIGEHVSRYLHGTHGARRPFWYYVPTLLGEFAPWSFFLPLALFVAYRRFRSAASRKREGELSSSEGLLLLSVWFAFGLVFFSLSEAKQSEYVLPLYPAAALMVAYLFSVLESERERAGLWRALRIVLVVLSIALLAAAGLLLHAARALFPARALAPLPACVLGAAVLGLIWGGWSRRPRRVLGVLVVAVALVHTSFAALLPEIERYRPVKPLAERIRREAGPEDLVGYYRYTAPSLCYYTGRKILEVFSAEELRALHGSGRRLFFLMSERDARALKAQYGLAFRSLECRPSLFPLKMKDFVRLRGADDLERVCLVTSP